MSAVRFNLRFLAGVFLGCVRPSWWANPYR